MLKGHGDDGYLFGSTLAANFSSNVFYEGLSEEFENFLSNCIGKVKNYPEPLAESFVLELSKFYNLDASFFLATNGATEAFYLIAQCFQGRRASIVIPTFAEYEDACKVYNMQLSFIEWDKLNYINNLHADLLFICNPNNPTGSILKQEELERIILAFPETIIVLDEAYIDFTNAIQSFATRVQEFKNLIVVRSLTKAYALPGLRLGYMLAAPEIIQKINSVRMPWAVNTLAIEAGKYILQNYDQMLLPVSEILESTKLLLKGINQISNIDAYSSRTNFFLCRIKNNTAQKLKKYLLNTHHILIRDASNFRGLTVQHFRIACQTEKENEFLIKALQEWSKKF